MNNSSPEPNHRGSKPPVDNSSGEIVFSPPIPHPCTPPEPYPVGALWRCNCGSEWRSLPAAPGSTPNTEWVRWPGYIPQPRLPDPFREPEHPPFPVIPVLILLLIAIALGIGIILSSG